MASHSPAIQSFTQSTEDKTLSVSWANGDTQEYPYIWLRDNCQCISVCWHKSGLAPRAGARFDLNLDVVPKSVEVTSSNPASSMDIEWSDGHKSQYLSSWLSQYRFNKSPEDVILNPKLRYWAADIDEKHQLKRYDFEEILTSDEAFLNWISDLKELGIALIVNAPKKEGELQRLGNRVNFLSRSNFGHIWKVQTRYTASREEHNVAYHTGFLPLHTDLSTYQSPAGLLLFHCLQAAIEGGESLLADGFKVAEDLRRDNPEAFEILTTTVFENFEKGNATDYHGKYHAVSKHPIIRLDQEGCIRRIVNSDHTRTPMLRVPVSSVLPVYRAMKLFHGKLHHPDNLFKYKLKEGDILCVNNYRVLHGRADFKVTEQETTNRHFEGAYLDWDQVNLRMRVLLEEKATKQ
ncbi:gamma-butyrobetaine dioxygenase-like [Amphiura filiformis]|uniref:gamma-butyrobetaine dioxygenase-like n=1 Tax=Amphiura filiformis TaxID=82378 RepID=UPI003B215BA8